MLGILDFTGSENWAASFQFFLRAQLCTLILGSTGERTKSSRGHQPPTQEFANLQSPPATPEHQPAVRGEKAEEGSTLSPPRSPEAKTNSKREDLESPKGTPQKRGKQTSGKLCGF